ncbi:MAG: response regulator [Actinomycetales bacterium]|jgi:AmiR/NasT family two-component response regulator|nr:response regulator [Actinomycetales bacterium]
MSMTRILIAEDETLIRMDLSEMLKEAGYEVVGEATDGLEAIELAKQLKPDLAILDVKMPKLDGISAASEIISICPTLMLTAFSQRELVERARDAGVMGYVVKPFTIADLIPAIEIAFSRFIELSKLRDEISDLSERLETRKLLDRAKGVLMQTLNLSEVQAYQWIQKTAMDQRISMKELALGILDPKLIKNDPPKSGR